MQTDTHTDHARYMASIGYSADWAERDADWLKWVAARIVTTAKMVHDRLALSDCYDRRHARSLADMAVMMAECAVENLNDVGGALLLDAVRAECAKVEGE